MSLNPIHLIEHRIETPRDLSALTRIDHAQEVAPEAVGLTTKDRDAIWAATEGLYRTGIYPAISLCIRRHGKILVNRSIGHSHGNGPGDHDAPVLASPDTPFCLFSASKAITAMLVHLMDEQGLIHLLNPVAYYLPEFAQNGKKNITIHQLLSHRAGIAALQEKVDPEILFDNDTLIKMLCAAKPTTVHGREQAYHALTAGYILGELVQRLTGMNIRDYLRIHVQEPLGMKYFNYGIDRAHYPLVARNYFTGLPLVFPMNLVVQRILNVSLEKAIEVSNDPRFYDQIIPAGNMAANAEECTRFFQCMLNGGEYEGKQIFKPLTIQRAVQEVGPMQLDRQLLLPMRFSAGMMLGDNPWGIFGPRTHEAYGHLGLTNNFCWADPERHISATLLTSGNPVMGSHFPALVKLLATIAKRCKTGKR